MKILTILCLILFVYELVNSILIPESFEDNHKRLYQKEISTSQLLKLLSLYEIDSHIEVVLIGKAFNYKIAEDLSKTLEILSSTSRKFTPLRYVHEKLIYHVTISNSLEKQIYDIIESNNVIETNKITNLLTDYHIRATTTTTLFIMHFNDKAGNYSYASPLSFCSQRAFISTTGYAWLDLSAKASVITPSYIEDNILLTPDLSKLVFTSKISHLYELASLVHRSGEALIPFPLSNKDFIQMVPLPSNSFNSNNIISNTISSFYSIKDIHREVQVILITICALDDTSLCDDDQISYASIEQLSQMYSTSSLKIGFTTIKMNLHNEPELSHAFHSSSRVTSANSGKMFSSSELVYWLGSSSKMRDSFSKLNGDEWGLKEKEGSIMSKKILPVFSILLPTTAEAFFEDYQKTKFVNFPEPPGGWGISKLDNSEDAQYARDIASRLLWPSTAVLHLQHIHEATGKSNILQSNGLQCDGIDIVPTRNEVGQQLKTALREAIWGIQPPHLHYSSASHGIVHDYLWTTSPSLYEVDQNLNDNSFREKRAVPRNILIKRCEYIISRFASVLQTAEAIYPPVNMSHLLGLGQSSQTNAGKKSDPGPKGSKQFKINSVDLNIASDNENNDSKGLLEDFLVALDAAATDISHLEYDIAHLRINNAETKLSNIEKEVNSILSSRQGQILIQNEESHESNIAVTSSSFTRNILIVISIIIGVSSAFIVRNIYY